MIKSIITKYGLNREHEIQLFDLILLKTRILQFLESHTVNFQQLPSEEFAASIGKTYLWQVLNTVQESRSK